MYNSVSVVNQYKANTVKFRILTAVNENIDSKLKLGKYKWYLC